MFQASTTNDYKINIPSTFHEYKILKYISSGSTCITVLVEDQKTNEKYAAKIISIEDALENNYHRKVIKETRILKSLSHPNIINIKESFEIENADYDIFIVIIMEYCENGDLVDYLLNNEITDTSFTKEIMQGVLSAVKYLHEKEISHGDIKLENILLDSNLSPKLCDFGYVRTERYAGDEARCGTLYYCAPEVLIRGEQFDTLKSDIYALGISFYTMDQLKFPFNEGDDRSVINQILEGNFSYNKEMDKQLLSLVKKCTAMDPNQRPDINDILNDEYLSNIEHSSIDNNSEFPNEITT